MNPASVQASWTARLLMIAGGLGAGAALLVLVGWYSQDPFLVQVHPIFPPVQWLSALGLLAIGLGLVLLGGRRVRPARAAGALAAGYALYLALGVWPDGPGITVLPNEPANACALLGLGLMAVSLLGGPALQRWHPVAPGAVAALAAVQGLAGLAGAALAKAAHALKGAASSLGELAVAETAARLEALAQEGDLEEAAAACALLEKESERLLQALEEAIRAETASSTT